MWYPQVRLIKEDYLDILRIQEFSGIELREVKLFSDRNCSRKLDGYVELRVTAFERVDEQLSGMKLEFDCPVCGARSYSNWNRKLGLHFENRYEALPDLFQMDQRPGMIFVKPRFAQFVVDLGLRPLTLTRFQDIVPLKF